MFQSLKPARETVVISGQPGETKIRAQRIKICHLPGALTNTGFNEARICDS